MSEEYDAKAFAELEKSARAAEAAPEKPISAPSVTETASAEMDKPESEEKPSPPVKLVKLEALHEARQQNRELRQRMAEQDARFRLAEDRLNQLAQAQQPKGPTFEENPAEYLRANLERTAQENAAIKAGLINQQRSQQEVAQLRALEQWGATQAASYREEHKDFDAAYQHVRGHRINEYRGMGMNPVAAEQAVLNDERQFLLHAYQTQQDPAELVHSMARQTGFKAQPVSEEEKITKMAEGAKASKQMRGGAAPKVSLEMLASLDQEDFKAAMERGDWDKMLRGMK